MFRAKTVVVCGSLLIASVAMATPAGASQIAFQVCQAKALQIRDRCVAAASSRFHIPRTRINPACQRDFSNNMAQCNVNLAIP